LLKYRWPGNVRELENIIERLVITTKESIIGPENLPSYIFENARSPGEISISQCYKPAGYSRCRGESRFFPMRRPKYKTTREIARALNISQPTVVRKLAKHGL
jgi:transcriptional regulator with PAS, ATPase and Fis domain